MSVWIFVSRGRLKGMLILAVSLFLVWSLSSIYGGEKGKRELKIRTIRSRGLGPEKINVPREVRTYYEVGTSKEKIYTVMIKNSTKEEKRDVRVKLSVYDKKHKFIEEQSPYWLKDIYANEGYLYEERILSPRKSVKLYFSVDKRARYVKAELFCEGELIDVKTDPRTFKPPRVKKPSSEK